MIPLPALCAIVTYNRLEFTRRCWESILATTDPAEIRVAFFDNGSTDGTREWLEALGSTTDLPSQLLGFFTASENVGTARAINHIWRLRKPHQPVIKLDNDIVFQTAGWVTRMVEILSLLPDIGELGLKRKDLAERAYFPSEPVKVVSPFFRSQLYELHTGEIIETVNHVLGSCVMFSPLALDKLGDLYQMQDLGNVYGFDDSLASLRLRLLDFQCAFARGTLGSPLLIDHIDPGAGGTQENGAYTEFKRRHAAEWMPQYDKVVAEFQSGQREAFWIDPDIKPWPIQQAERAMANAAKVDDS